LIINNFFVCLNYRVAKKVANLLPIWGSVAKKVANFVATFLAISPNSLLQVRRRA